MIRNRFGHALRSAGVFLVATFIGLVPNLPGLEILRDFYPGDLKWLIPVGGLLMGATAVLAHLRAARRPRGRVDGILWSGWIVLLAGLVPFLLLNIGFVRRWDLGKRHAAVIVGSVDKSGRPPECPCPPSETDLECIKKHLTANPEKIDSCWGERRMGRIRGAYALSYLLSALGVGILAGVVPLRFRRDRLPLIDIKLFLSYRRADSQAITDRIYDRLTQRIRAPDVFKDVDSIAGGEEFPRKIRQFIAEADLMLAVIGPVWSRIEDDEGNRRLEDPSDFVRLEIEAGLRQKERVQILPLLVEGASMPDAEELPESLRPLKKSNALPIRHDPDFETDMGRLFARLQEIAEARPLLQRMWRMPLLERLRRRSS